MNESKGILVAYFSCSGVTKRAAQMIAEASGGNLFEIKPEIPYTKADLNWRDAKSRSSVEMNNPTSRPAIANVAEGMEGYNTVFLGFPIWWYTAPKIIMSFLESCDFSGKTVIVFATSGGSGTGNIVSDLRACCSCVTSWKPAMLLNHVNQADVAKRLRQYGIE